MGPSLLPEPDGPGADALVAQEGVNQAIFRVTFPGGGCYHTAMKRLLVLCLAALALAGCESHPLSTTVSPRLTGRVLAADTGQPIANVKITSLDQADRASSTMPPKGGQMLQAETPIRTDQDGRFLLERKQVFAPFRGADWFSVVLSFEHAGYERFITNYSYLNVGTNTVNGKPGLTAGNILLQPVAK